METIKDVLKLQMFEIYPDSSPDTGDNENDIYIYVNFTSERISKHEIQKGEIAS